MRDFLSFRLASLLACLVLAAALPTGAQTINSVKGPDFGTVSSTTGNSVVTVNMDPATGLRTSAPVNGVAIGPSAASPLGSITFTVPAGHSWRFVYNFVINQIILNPTINNGRTVQWFPTTLNGPNLYPNGDGPFVSDGQPITRTFSGYCQIGLSQPAGTYRGTLPVLVQDTTTNRTTTQNVTIQVIVASSPSLTKVNDLSFGAILASSTNGTVVVPATGTASKTGSVIFLPTYSGGVIPKAAQFTVGGTTGSVVAITLPTTAVILTEAISGKTLTVDTFTRSPTGNVLLAATPTAIFVGATLQVTTAPVPGTYSGVFTVLAAYN